MLQNNSWFKDITKGKIKMYYEWNKNAIYHNFQDMTKAVVKGKFIALNTLEMRKISN